MKESTIERKFLDRVKQLGGVAIKLSMNAARGQSGWPDRLVVLKDAYAFVELKRPGNTLTELQRSRLNQLQALGHPTAVLNDIQKIDQLLTWIQTYDPRLHRRHRA